MVNEINFSQIFENFNSFEEWAKSTNHITKLFGHIKSGVVSIDNIFKNKSIKKDFEHIYHLKDFHLTDKRKGIVFNVDKEDLLNAHYLVCSLFFRYQVKATFNEIRIIGNNGQLNGLTMEEYYIELSYLDRNKIKKDTDLFIIEKEGNEIKRRKKTRSELYSNYMSANIISEALVVNFEQSVIIGNPGVGKSTFARWLCYQWAKQEVKVPFILLYINLRQLDFNLANPILYYIIQEYAPNCKNNPTSIETVLRNFSFDFKYILDGLDEIDQNDKVKLENELSQLTNQKDLPPFILLSRPYGISNTFFQGVRHFNEILGFNETQRKSYINSVLQANPIKEKSPAEFIKLIEKNLVLKDISYNPLMLSYMVLIYLDKDEESHQLFSQIYSPYQLQDTILGLLMQYHQRDKHIDSDRYSEQLENCKLISGKMELNKEFVYQGQSSRDKFKKPAMLLSELGVGRFESLDLSDKWQFYFTSVTFQEFLAAELYGELLNSKAFVYLFGDTFFWNFSKMLLGYMSAHDKISIVEDIFKELDTMLKESENLIYYQKLKYLIIGELSPNFIQQKVGNDEIVQMIEMSYWAVFDDLRGEIFIDSVHQIYLKFNPSQKEYFSDSIVYYLSFFLDLNSTDHHRIEFPTSIIKLINNLGLIQNSKIVGCLLEWLQNYHLKSEEVWKRIEPLLFDGDHKFKIEGSEEERLLNTYDFSMIEIYKLFESAKRESLLHHKNSIQQLIDDFPHSFEDKSLGLLMQLYDDDTHFQNAIKQYEFAKTTFANNLKQEDSNYLIDPKMDVLSRVCVGVAKAFAPKPIEEKQVVSGLLENVKTLFSYYCESDMCMDDEKNSIYNNFVDALIHIDDPQFFQSIFSLIAENEIPSLFDVSSPDAYLRFIDKQFKQITDSSKIMKDLKILLIIFGTTTLGRLSIYKYRESFFEIIQSLVLAYYDLLNEFFLMNEDDSRAEMTRQAAEIMESVNYTFSYSYDRKFLVEKYRETGLIENNYIKWRHIPSLLKEELSFYEDWIWQYIYVELIENKNLFEPVINILSNELLYNIPSNFTHIQRLWSEILAEKNRKNFQIVFEENHHTVFRAIYLALVNFCWKDNSTQSAGFIHLITGWLKAEEVKAIFFSKHNFNQLVILHETSLLYSVAAHLSDDHTLIPPDEMHHLMLSNPSLYRRASYELLYIFQSDMNVVRKLVPDLVYDKVDGYRKLDMRVNYNLDKERFLGMLNKEKWII